MISLSLSFAIDNSTTAQHVADIMASLKPYLASPSVSIQRVESVSGATISKSGAGPLETLYKEKSGMKAMRTKGFEIELIKQGKTREDIAQLRLDALERGETVDEDEEEETPQGEPFDASEPLY